MGYEQVALMGAAKVVVNDSISVDVLILGPLSCGPFIEDGTMCYKQVAPMEQPEWW